MKDRRAQEPAGEVRENTGRLTVTETRAQEPAREVREKKGWLTWRPFRRYERTHVAHRADTAAGGVELGWGSIRDYLLSCWCVVNEAWCGWGAAWGDVRAAHYP